MATNMSMFARAIIVQRLLTASVLIVRMLKLFENSIDIIFYIFFTTYPMRRPLQTSFRAEKIIILVGTPGDVIVRIGRGFSDDTNKRPSRSN